MTIAIHTGTNQISLTNSEWKHLFCALITHHPGEKFVFVSAKKGDECLPLLPNVIIPPAPVSSIPVLKKWRSKLLLGSLLAQYQADVFLTTDASLNFKTNIPQALLLSDSVVLRQTKNKPKKNKNAGQDRFSRSLAKANHIITVSYYTKALLQENFGVSGTKISVPGLPVPAPFKPLDWNEKQAVKDEFTGAREFFLYSGVISPGNHIITLLKAFSLFKKRQLSNMQLVLAGPVLWPSGSFINKLETYKYREDVIQMEATVEVLAKLAGAAYTCINTDTTSGYAPFQAQAVSCGAPIISCAAKAEPFFPGLITCNAEPEEIAEKMKQLYKDEHVKNTLAENALLAKQNCEPAVVAARLWKAIVQTVNN